MREIYVIFQDIEDPRGSNATRHDLHETPMTALPSTLSGGEGCDAPNPGATPPATGHAP